MSSSLPHNGFTLLATTTITTAEDEGLYELVMRGLHAAAEAAGGVVGSLDIELDADGEMGSVVALAIEAEFALREGRQIIDSINVRVVAALPAQGDSRALALELAERFGGTAFTNLSGVPAHDGEGIDVTVSFASRLPVLARNLVLVDPAASDEDLRSYSLLLDRLGMSHRMSGRRLSTPRRQIRTSMTTARQVDTYEAARACGLDACLYTATLPAARSMRLWETPPREQAREVDIVLSRGLSGHHVCTSDEVREMQRFVESHFGFRFGGQAWQVVNHYGGASSAARPPPARRGPRWRGVLTGSARS